MRSIFSGFVLLLALNGVQLRVAAQCTPQQPVGLYASDVSACRATLHWNSVPEIAYYKVRYKTATSAWSSPVKVGKDTLYTFSNLSNGTSYTLSVAAYCSASSKSPWSKLNATTQSCPSVLGASVQFPDSSTAHIVVETNCSASTYYYRYKLQAGEWNTLTVSNIDSLYITGLVADSMYTYQVNACNGTPSGWCAPKSFTAPSASRPNIILIILDDAMSNLYSCNGACSFFQTPNIDRIANEGINFTNSFVVTSLCMPSRAVMATGLFPTRTSVYENDSEEDALDTSFVVLSERLRPLGYYSAIIGKNHNTFGLGENSEFDYSMITQDVKDFYGEHAFELNGTWVEITGNTSIIMADTVAALIERTQQPLFTWMAFRIPHWPYQGMESFQGRYDDHVIPFGPDTTRFTQNYPSFLDELPPNRQLPSNEADSMWHVLYEVMGGVDSAIGHILNAVDASGKAENTLVIFTSDNGFLFGIHGLFIKEMAYDPSMRVPLFVRYPKWFDPSTVSGTMALNLDIAPTILEAAGVDMTDIPFDGLSLRRFYEGDTSRTDFYYLMKNPEGSNQPSWRAIRDMNYKYISYTCGTSAEEFFDMVNDPLEMNNLINHNEYQSLIETYRVQLNASRVAWNDTLPDPFPDCYLKNFADDDGQKTEAESSSLFEESDGGNYRNPSAEMVVITNLLGQVLFSGSVSGAEELRKRLSDGTYLFTTIGTEARISELVHIRRQ